MLPLAGRAFLQMDQAASPSQTFLGRQRECRTDTDSRRHHHILPCRHHRVRPQTGQTGR